MHRGLPFLVPIVAATLMGCIVLILSLLLGLVCISLVALSGILSRAPRSRSELNPSLFFSLTQKHNRPRSLSYTRSRLSLIAAGGGRRRGGSMRQCGMRRAACGVRRAACACGTSRFHSPLAAWLCEEEAITTHDGVRDGPSGLRPQYPPESCWSYALLLHVICATSRSV